MRIHMIVDNTSFGIAPLMQDPMHRHTLLGSHINNKRLAKCTHARLCVRYRGAGKRAAYVAASVLVDDILNRGICSSTKDNDTDDQNTTVEQRQHDIPGSREAAAFADKLEPEQRGEVESEARDEQGRDQTEKRIEEGDGLGDDPTNDSDDGDQTDPDGPATKTLNVADGRVGECAIHDIPAYDGSVDRS
jgi:hypothetical protein